MLTKNNFGPSQNGFIYFNAVKSITVGVSPPGGPMWAAQRQRRHAISPSPCSPSSSRSTLTLLPSAPCSTFLNHPALQSYRARLHSPLDPPTAHYSTPHPHSTPILPSHHQVARPVGPFGCNLCSGRRRGGARPPRGVPTPYASNPPGIGRGRDPPPPHQEPLACENLFHT